ncbi:unnamed protein product, partial [marine sediment metagenome]
GCNSTIYKFTPRNYEDLYKRMQKLHSEAANFFEKVRTIKRKSEIRDSITEYMITHLSIAEFADANRLFMDRDVTDHILLTGLTPSEILNLNPKSRSYLSKVEKFSAKFFEDYGIAIDMIEEYSGIDRLRKSIRKINRPITKSGYSEYMKEARKKYKSRP